MRITYCTPLVIGLLLGTAAVFRRRRPIIPRPDKPRLRRPHRLPRRRRRRRLRGPFTNGARISA